MREERDVYTALRQKTGITRPRGEVRSSEEYFLGVCVWLRRGDGRFLISRRAAEKETYPLHWEPTGGGVRAGETSLQAAHREVREELGLTIDEARGMLFATIVRRPPEFPASSFEDVYVFAGDWEESEITLQKEETCDARWATQAEIRGMIAAGTFVPARHYPYLEALFAFDF